MALATITSSASSASIFDFAAAALKSVVQAAQQHNAYRVTKSQLSQLSNRDLEDLGLTRSMINKVSREAAYGINA